MCTEKRSRYGAMLALPVLLLSGCSSCSGDDGAKADSGSDTDVDTDTDTDTGSEIEFGPTTPCENEARPGEVCIPGGNYLMGCVPGDTECEDNEKPLVMVTLSPFFIDVKEATVEDLLDWLNVIKNDPFFVDDPLGWNDGTGYQRIWGTSWPIGTSGEDSVWFVDRDTDGNYVFDEEAESQCPAQGGIHAAVGGFTWLGAKMYCEHKGMQLPTEAQWEAAARGQTKNEFPCGSDLAECWWGVYACCYESQTCYDMYSSRCHCCAPFDVDEAYTCVSPFGVKGMYGNASEWTADYVTADHSVCADGCVDPQLSSEPYDGAVHLLKGGDMSDFGQSWLRVSRRGVNNSDNGSSQTGVRCVRPDAPFLLPDAGVDGGR